MLLVAFLKVKSQPDTAAAIKTLQLNLQFSFLIPFKFRKMSETLMEFGVSCYLCKVQTTTNQKLLFYLQHIDTLLNKVIYSYPVFEDYKLPYLIISAMIFFFFAICKFKPNKSKKTTTHTVTISDQLLLLLLTDAPLALFISMLLCCCKSDLFFCLSAFWERF